MYAKRLGERWDEMFSPKTDYQTTREKMEDEIKQLEGFIGISKHQFDEQMKKGTFKNEDEIDQMATMIAQQEEELRRAQERYDRFLGYGDDYDRADAQNRQVRLARMRQSVSGNAETRDEYVARMMAQKEQQLLDERGKFGMETDERAEADRIYQQFLSER